MAHLLALVFTGWLAYVAMGALVSTLSWAGATILGVVMFALNKIAGALFFLALFLFLLITFFL